MNNKSVLRMGELFCGPGGLALGAKLACQKNQDIGIEIEHAWATDIDPDACLTYANNICPYNKDSVICKDVRQLSISEISPIDCLAFGFPCNDFSIVGEQKGFHGSYGPLYTYGVKVINHYKPKFFVAENVGGLATANYGEALAKILSELRNAGCGYNLTTHLYKSEEYGIPQKRHRIFIIGIAQRENLIYKVPRPTHQDNYLSVRSALENPPIPTNAYNHEYTRQSDTVIQRLKHIRPGENAWTSPLPDNLKINVKNAKLSQIYKRLEADKPSYTITGSGGGGTHVYHWSEPRALTNRERARLQTFPDDFIFYGSKESVRKQIGMAVPPKMAEIIFEHILLSIAGRKYPYVEPNIVEEATFQYIRTNCEL